MNSIQLVVAFAIIIAAGFPPVQGTLRAVHFENYTCHGWYGNNPGKYHPELRSIGWDNRIRSIQAAGIWLLFQNENYNGYQPGKMEWVFGRQPYCFNLRITPGSVSSLKYAGHPSGIDRDSFTVYQQDHFQGQEDYTIADQPYFNKTSSQGSLIVTGLSEWTVYSEPNYRGRSICLKWAPGENGPFVIFNFNQLREPIRPGSVASVRKGCQSFGSGSRMVMMHPIEKPYRPYSNQF